MSRVGSHSTPKRATSPEAMTGYRHSRAMTPMSDVAEANDAAAFRALVGKKLAAIAAIKGEAKGISSKMA